MPRTSQASLLQKQMLSRITCPQIAPSWTHTHERESDLEHQHSFFLGAAGHQSQLGSLLKRKSALCNLALRNYFSPLRCRDESFSSSGKTSQTQMFLKKKNKWNKDERERGRKIKQFFVFSS